MTTLSTFSNLRAVSLALVFFLSAGFACARSVAESHEPRLCDARPDLCKPKTPEQEQLPAESGWLCCMHGGNCIAVDVATDCVTGYVGWCGNYTEKDNDVGQAVATCHDEPAA